ncbi:MAG: hypothetical protein LBQ54_04485 [Planctomycetaceae bacterium]|nr:hypothetical protein [Planctomycetaceae bacterium]
MSCRLVRFAVMLCMIFFAGCRVCSSPYDNCGPVGSVGGMDCDPLYRNGSVLNGYRGGTYYGGSAGSAQARPYDETQGTPIKQISTAPQGIPSATRSGRTPTNQPTPARPATDPQSRVKVPSVTRSGRIPINRPTAAANPNDSIPDLSAPTPAREAPPLDPAHSSQSSRISIHAVPKVSLTQESLLQQEQGAVDLRIIDVQDNPSPVLH